MRALPEEPCTVHVLLDPDRHRGAADARVDALVDVLTSITPAVEVVGPDQAFLDVAGARRLLGPPPIVAAALRRRVRERTGAGCAVGVAPTRTVARLASARAAPDGVVVVPADAVPAFMAPLPLDALPGVGPATAARLARLGLRRVADVDVLDRRALVRVLGRALTDRVVTVAAGDDPRPSPGHGGSDRSAGAVAVAGAGAGSGPWGALGPDGADVGGEHAFDRDVVDEDAVLRAVLALCAAAAAVLRADARAGRTVALMVRLADGTALTRSTVLDEPTDLTAPLRAGAGAAWARLGLQRARVRAVGVRVGSLVPAAQAHHQPFLGEREVGWAQGERAVDAALARFGLGAVHPASLLGLAGAPGAARAPQRLRSTATTRPRISARSPSMGW